METGTNTSNAGPKSNEEDVHIFLTLRLQDMSDKAGEM